MMGRLLNGVITFVVGKVEKQPHERLFLTGLLLFVRNARREDCIAIGMEIHCVRYEAYLLYLPAAHALDRRILAFSECEFDGHVVLSTGSWTYSSKDSHEAGDWRFEHSPSGGFTPQIRKRVEMTLRTVPDAAPVAQLTSIPSFDHYDGEWLSNWLWTRFGRPSIVWLDVPYAAKDRAKRLGARWNPQAHRWYGLRSVDFDMRGLSAWMRRRTA